MASEPTQEQSQEKLPTAKYFIAQCYIKPNSPEHALWTRVKENFPKKRTGEIILLALRLLDKKINSLKQKNADDSNTPAAQPAADDVSTTPAVDAAGGD